MNLYAIILALIVLTLLTVSLTRLGKVHTRADYLVAGRSLPAFVLVFTLLSSWIGSGSLLGGAENAYRHGFVALWGAAGGWAGLALIYFIAPRARHFAQYTIPAKSILMLSPWVVQRDPRWFPEPEIFRPERPTAEAKAKRPRFAYFPFGGGGRQCIGESFALMEATLALATIAQRWRLQLVPNQTIELQPKITLRPKSGIRAIPIKRSA